MKISTKNGKGGNCQTSYILFVLHSFSNLYNLSPVSSSTLTAPLYNSLHLLLYAHHPKLVRNGIKVNGDEGDFTRFPQQNF